MVAGSHRRAFLYNLPGAIDNSAELTGQLVKLGRNPRLNDPGMNAASGAITETGLTVGAQEYVYPILWNPSFKS
jgi:hypothetical protein